MKYTIKSEDLICPNCGVKGQVLRYEDPAIRKYYSIETICFDTDDYSDIECHDYTEEDEKTFGVGETGWSCSSCGDYDLDETEMLKQYHTNALTLKLAGVKEEE